MTDVPYWFECCAQPDRLVRYNNDMSHTYNMHMSCSYEKYYEALGGYAPSGTVSHLDMYVCVYKSDRPSIYTSIPLQNYK